MPAHIAEARRAEDGVDERVHDRIAVRVPQQAAVVGDEDSAEHQAAAQG